MRVGMGRVKTIKEEIKKQITCLCYLLYSRLLDEPDRGG